MPRGIILKAGSEGYLSPKFALAIRRFVRREGLRRLAALEDEMPPVAVKEAESGEARAVAEKRSRSIIGGEVKGKFKTARSLGRVIEAGDSNLLWPLTTDGAPYVAYPLRAFGDLITRLRFLA